MFKTKWNDSFNALSDLRQLKLHSRLRRQGQDRRNLHMKHRDAVRPVEPVSAGAFPHIAGVDDNPLRRPLAPDSLHKAFKDVGYPPTVVKG